MQDTNPEQLAAKRLAEADSDFQTLHEIVAKARQNLSQNDWDYIAGGTETETTLRRNRLALDSVAFRPRVLRDVSRVEAGVTAFGRPLRLPVLSPPRPRHPHLRLPPMFSASITTRNFLPITPRSRASSCAPAG